jgi:hypothetical protein
VKPRAKEAAGTSIAGFHLLQVSCAGLEAAALIEFAPVSQEWRNPCHSWTVFCCELWGKEEGRQRVRQHGRGKSPIAGYILPSASVQLCGEGLLKNAAMLCCRAISKA